MTLPGSKLALSLLVLLLASLLVPAAAAAQPRVDPLGPDQFQNLLAPQSALVRPRVVAAYGALMTAITLGILFLYRGRDYILYWVATWLLLAGALAIVSQSYPHAGLANGMLGVAMLLVVWAAGATVLAVAAFPVFALRWTLPVRFGAVTALVFLGGPAMFPVSYVLRIAVVVTLVLVGVAAAEYMRVARDSRYAGALLAGAGLAVLCAANVLGSLAILSSDAAAAILDQLSVVNVITSIFVALGMHVLVFEDMTDELRHANRDLAAANEEVKRLAITDPLTGCHNRRFFEEIERREMQRHRRYDAPLSVVFVDVDRFKQLNDTLGHDMGDDVLRTIGAMLRRHVRQSDYVIRWGGDEFLLLLSCGLGEAHRKADELKVAFERERLMAALPATLGLSVGVSAVSKTADNLRSAIRHADALMYRDKMSERSEPEVPPSRARDAGPRSEGGGTPFSRVSLL